MRVYSTFANRGVRVEPELLITARTKQQILLDRGHFADPAASLLTRASRLSALPLEPPKRVMHETHAFQLLHMLRAVVTSGTAGAASALGVPAAGKTGTTNAYDTWFVGFTSTTLTSVWVGADDNDRAVGRRETGGRVSLPIWLQYMREVVSNREQGPLLNNPPEGITLKRIDREIGLLSKEGEPGISLPFVEGNSPVRSAPDRNQKTAARVDRMSTEF